MSSTSTAAPLPSARPVATCSPGVLDWSINSRGQDPCFVASTIAGVCFEEGGYTLAPLPPEGNYQYRGISAYKNRPCMCNTVYYSLECACAACQHPLNGWDRWLYWSTNCSMTYTMYPQHIPPSVAIPAWAYLDVTAGNIFNITLAQTFVGFADSVAPPMPTSTTSTQAPVTPTQPSTNPAVTSPTINIPPKQNNIGAIVGGVVGGLAVIILAGVLVICLLRRRGNKGRGTTHPIVSPLDAGTTLQSLQSPASTTYGASSRSFDGKVTSEPKYQDPTTQRFSSDNPMQYSPQTLLYGSGSQPISNPPSSFPAKPVVGQTYYKSLLPEPIE